MRYYADCIGFELAVVLRALVLIMLTAVNLPVALLFTGNGIGMLEAFGLLGRQSAEISIFASSLFIISAVIYAVIWARFFRAGPIEWLMRRVAG